MEKPDIIGIIEKEGMDLWQRGRHFWGLCPIHTERTPSFCVDQEKQRFKCFGCGAGGDVVDFIMKLKNVSFPDALEYLGISDNKQVKQNPQETRRCELVEKFKTWCGNYTKWLCEMLRMCNQIDSLVKTPDDLEPKGIGEMYLLKDVYQYHLSILKNREDETKFELYEEVCYGNRNRKN